MKKLTNNSYIPLVDFWKCIFTVAIILYHANKMEGFEKANLFPYGYIFVEFFFMVSGFFMAKSVFKMQSKPINSIANETWRFTLKKASGIYIPVFVAFWIHFAIRMHIEKLEYQDVLLEITHSIRELTFTYSSGLTIGRYHNGPTWYISSMLIGMFLIYPILRKYFNTFSSIVAPAFALLSYAYLQKNHSSINLSSHYGEWICLGLFRAICGLCVGIFIFSLVEKFNNTKREFTTTGKVFLLVVELGLALYLILIATNYDNLFKEKFYGYFAMLLQAILVFVLFLNPIKIQNGLFAKLCLWAGEISFYYYLNHRIWTRVFETYIPDLGYGKKQILILYFIHTTITVIFSMVLCHFLEKAKPHIFNFFKNLFIKEPEEAIETEEVAEIK